MPQGVDVLLRKIAEGVDQVEAHYEHDLDAQEVSDELLYAVRNVVQDCQSALDWTASAVAKKLYGKMGFSPYFPLRRTPGEFAKAIEKQIPGLAAGHPTVAAAFERHQPYQPGKAELRYIHTLSRVNKHQDFTAQTKIERHVTRSQYSGAVVETDNRGNTFVRPVPGSTNTIFDPSTAGVPTVECVVYIDWRFTNPDVSVLATLDALAMLVRAAVEDVRSEAAL